MDYQKLYTHLFNAMTDALEAMEAQNYGVAAELLRAGQLWTEDIYMKEGQSDEETADLQEDVSGPRL